MGVDSWIPLAQLDGRLQLMTSSKLIFPKLATQIQQPKTDQIMKKPSSSGVLRIMKTTPSLVVLSGILTLASAQAQVYTTLYDEDWGAAYGSVPGNTAAGTLQQIGWSFAGGQYTGMYAQNGAFDVTTGVTLSNRPCYFSSSIVSDAAIIYTQAGDGSGTNGTAAFASIDPTTNPGLFFSVDAQVNQNATFGQTNYWAVKVGGAWYVSVKGVTNNSPATGPIFALNTLPYDPAAGNWNNLTITGSGATPSGSITIGGAAAALSGTIDGIGIVQVWAASISGNTPGFNYLNLRIQKPLAIPADPTAPVIKGYGYSQTNYAGAVVSFAVNAPIGTAPLTYSWIHDGGVTLGNGATGTGSAIFGATTSQITISNISAADAGVYSVAVANGTGSDNLANYDTNTLTVLTPGPELLYSEIFPFVGPLGTAMALSNIGWRVTSPATALPNRLDSGNQLYAYESAARTMAFVTSSNWDNGVSGLTFPPAGITPANYPFVSFRSTYAAAQNAGNASVYFAVQMNAGGTTNWFVSTSANLAADGTPTTYGLQFSPVASGWNRLTLNLTGNATVGAAASSDLAGKITGVGLVFVFTAPALYFVNDVSLVTNSTPPIPPSFPSLPNVPYLQTVYSGGRVSFSFTEAGTLPFTNNWDFNGGPALLTDGTTASGSIISGSGTAQITIQDVSSADAGGYRGVVSNPAGTSYSDTGIYGAAQLTVTAPPVGLIYTESFPLYFAFTANQPLSIVGWTNQSDSPARLFKIPPANVGSGAAFAYQGGTTNSLFYGSTDSDTGFSGLPFIAFNPANYPAGSLQFSAAFASGNANYTNVTASFAVKSGGNWYVNATPVIPYNAVTLTGTYTPFSQTMSFAAGQWQQVTLVGSAGVIVGALTTQPLTGTITAAGLLFQHTFVVTVPANFGGSMNWNSFAIQALGVTGDNLIGGLNINTGSNGTDVLSWIGNPAVNLQSTTNLSAPNWQDVPNTLGNHTLTVTPAGSQKYYRLVGPAAP